MKTHGALAVFKRGELLPTRNRNGGIARHDFFHQTAHGFQTQRQRNHIQQQPVICAGTIARQHIGLHGCAQRHHFVGVKISERCLAEKFADGMTDARHPCRAAHHNHAFNFVSRQPGIAQRLACRGQGFAHQHGGNFVELGCSQIQVNQFTGGQQRSNTCFVVIGQLFLGFTCASQQQARVFGI